MSDFKAKVHQNRFRPQTPLQGGAYSAPRLPSWNTGDLLLTEGKGPGRGRGVEGGKAGGGRQRKGGRGLFTAH